MSIGTAGLRKLRLLLLKSVGIDDDVALLRIVPWSRCIGMKMAP